MSKTKEALKARKKQLEDELKPYEALKEELEDVNKALNALEPKKKKTTCEGPRSGCSGCDICRMGPEYR